MEKKSAIIGLIIMTGLVCLVATEGYAQSSEDSYRCSNCKKSHTGNLSICPTCNAIFLEVDEEVDEKEVKKQLDLQAKFHWFMVFGIYNLLLMTIIFIASLISYIVVGASRRKRERLEKEETARQSALANPTARKHPKSPFKSRKAEH